MYSFFFLGALILVNNSSEPMEALALEFFGSKLNWYLNPNSESLDCRIKSLAALVLERHRPTLVDMETIEEEKRALPLDSESPPAKRVKLDEEQKEEENSPEVSPQPLPENPKTPELPDAGDDDAPECEVPPEQSEESSEESKSSEESPVEEPDEPPMRAAEVKDLNQQYPGIFVGKFLITEPHDSPPSETEYEAEVIAPREVESVRQKKAPERYDDSKFEDIEDLKNGETKKTKKTQTLEKKLGIKGKLQIVLTELGTASDMASIALVEKSLPRIQMFSQVINNRLQELKSQIMLLGFPTVSAKDYNLNRLSESDLGKALISVIANTLKNVIISGTTKVRLLPIKHTGVLQLMHDMRNSVRSELETKIHTFKFYSAPVIPDGLVLEELPRNSLELVLLYVRMNVVFESGFEDNSCYVVEFSLPRELGSGLPPRMVFRLKYQYMVQMRWLYYLVNPLRLVESIVRSVWEGYKELKKDTDWTIIGPREVGEVATKILGSNGVNSSRFLSEFVTLSLNFASLFGVSYFKSLFEEFHILATPMPKSQLLTVSKGFT